METNEAPKEKKYSYWFLAGYYFRKVVAWMIGLFGFFQASGEYGGEGPYQTSGGMFVLAAVYLLVNTKKE
jgi:hypothetical protein